MTMLRLEGFGGIAPRYSARLLPKGGAVAAQNAKLLSGELRGLHETQLMYDFNQLTLAHPIARAYRLPSSVAAPIPISGGDQWLGFYDPNVDFVRTPVLQDSFERYYWTGNSYVNSGAPQYSTRALINSTLSTPGVPNAYLLGVPAPVNTLTLTPATGAVETRAYLITFVSAYGEEGSPGPPISGTGAVTGTWTLGNLDTVIPSPYTTVSNITTVRIYRTVSGTSTTAFFHVADVALGTATYNDTALDAAIALNFTLPSLTWLTPPATLQGLIAHPGGFLVGFSGRDLYMSEPYQPHAWPVQYIQTCQTEIVGIAIFNNTIVVMTTSHPYVGSGMSPLAVTLQKLDSIDPCVSRRSIATTLAGVFYASPQGIIMNDGTQSQLVTQQLFTREEWQNQFSPTTVNAVPYGMQYIAFDTSAQGFIFSPNESNAPLTTLDRFTNVATVQIDSYSGDVYLVQQNQTRLWDPPASIPYTYTWTSKQFDLPKPVNMGAFRLKFNGNSVQISSSQLADYTTFNNARIAHPLNPINGSAINGVRPYNVVTLADPPGSVLPQIKNPVGGSALFPIGALQNQGTGVIVQMFARDLAQNWNMQYSNTITTEKAYRLPQGYKSDGYYFSFIGNTNVYSFSVAETPKELMNE